MYSKQNRIANISLYLHWIWRGCRSGAWFCSLFKTIMTKLHKQTKATFSTKGPAWFFCPTALPPVCVKGHRCAQRIDYVNWPNSSHRRDRAQFKCLLFDVLMVCVTFGVLEGVKQTVQCSMQLFQYTLSLFAEGVKHLLGSETSSHRGWKELSGWQHSCHKRVLGEVLVSISFSRTFRRIACLSKLKLLIHLWSLRCRRVRENFLFSQISYSRPLTVHQWIPVASVKTIFSHGATEVCLSDCQEQGAGKVMKSIVCVHLGFPLLNQR